MGGWETNWNRDVLERIVVLLFALAGLADRAAGVPFLRRRQILGILSCGEVEARAFVIGMACGAPVPTDALETTTDAVCLAVRLRALALMLCLVLAQAAQFALPRMIGPRADRRKPAVAAGRRTPTPDTS
jgi:hypothetical protein